MRNLICAVLGSLLLVTACATSGSDNARRPNSAAAMENGRQAQPKDPHDYVNDPTIGSAPPEHTVQRPTCHLQCGPGTHCDASGFVERCVQDEDPKP